MQRELRLVLLVVFIMFQWVVAVTVSGQTEKFPTYVQNASVPGLSQGTSDICGSAFIDKDGIFRWMYSFAGYAQSDAGDSWIKVNTNTDMGKLNTSWGTTTTCNTYWNRAGTIAYKTDLNTPKVASPYQDDHDDAVGTWVDPSNGYWYSVINDEYCFNPLGATTQTQNERISTGVHSNRVLSCYSTDKGVTWKLIGQVATTPWNDNNENATKVVYPGSTWSYGLAGTRFFVDNINGYFYCLYNTHVNWSPGYSSLLVYFHLARSPISAKMADGSWNVWSNGAWTNSALKGIPGWIGNPMGAGNPNTLAVTYKPLNDSLIFTGTGMDGSSIHMSYTKVASSGVYTFKNAVGDSYKVDFSKSTITNSAGATVPSVSYSDPALDATVTLSIASSKLQIKQVNNLTGHSVTGSVGSGNPLFKDTKTDRVFFPNNTQYQNAFSYNVYSGNYRSIGYDAYVYETEDLGSPNTFSIVGKDPGHPGSYETQLDHGSLTNQQVSSFSYRMISDASGSQMQFSMKAPAAGQTYFSAYSPPKDSSGTTIAPATIYTIKVGGTLLKENASEQWKFVPVPDEFFPTNNSGFYRIQNVTTGNYLEVAGSTVPAKRAIGAALAWGPMEAAFSPTANSGNGSGCGSDQWYLLPVGNATPAFLTPSSTPAEIAAACNTSTKGIITYKLVNRTSALAVEFVNGIPTLQGHKFGKGNPQSLIIRPFVLSSVNEISESDFTLYPVPASTSLDLVINNNNLQHITLSLIDLLGKKVLERKITDNAAHIDVSGYEQGIYFVELKTGQSSFTKKIAIIR
jgi:Secretion system C-terminal sorting domain